MSARPAVIVLVLAALGVLAALLVARHEQAPRAGAGALGPLVEALPVERIERVTVARRNGPTLVFARADRAWRQVEPFEHPMDGYALRQLAILAAEVVPLRWLSAAEAAGDLGLDPPRGVLAFEWPGGSVTLQFGRRGVAGRWYVRRAGGAAAVATGGLYERAVEMDTREWRDRTIFLHAGVDADEVEIVEGGRRIRLVRERRQWRMVEPAATRLDPAARDELFAALGRARVGGFILDQPGDLSAFGLQEPAGSVTVSATRWTEEAGGVQTRSATVRERLVVGGPLGVGAQDRFGLIEGRPTVVRLPEAVLRSLFGAPERLIDPTGSGVQIADVQEILIRGPAGTLRLSRDLDLWTAPEAGGPVAAEPVARLLEALVLARAPEVERRAYPRELEVATVTLTGAGGRPLDTVRIAREPETGRLALENGDDVLRIFPAGTAIPLTPAAFGVKQDPAPGTAG